MSISAIALALAAQPLGPEVTTFHPLPSQKKEKQEQAKQQASQPAEPKPQAQQEPAKPPEEIKLLSVRVIPPSASVTFVPPEGEEEPE